MAHALILGGTGLIGRATARRLLVGGWRVDVTGRVKSHLPADIAASGGRFLITDGNGPEQLRAAMGSGVDLLVDCICFTAADATGLLPLAREAGSTVMISSKAVDVDAAGHQSNSATGPRFSGPVRETRPTMAPSNGDYNSAEGYGANKVAAEQVLLDSGLPVTVLRPFKVHGQGALKPNEWVFVKRVLDQRPVVLLAHRGEGVDHTTAAANIAALIETVAGKPGQRILNIADPDAPSALQISRTIAQHLHHPWDEVLLDDDAPEALGQYPWDKRPPVVLDMTASSELGYRPAGDYKSTVVAELDWLVSTANRRDGNELPSGFDTPTSPPCSTTRQRTITSPVASAEVDRILDLGGPGASV